jgi:hypothetical protein
MRVNYFLMIIAGMALASAAHLNFDSQYLEVSLVFPENETLEVSTLPFLIEFNFDITSSNPLERCDLIINDVTVAENYNIDDRLTNIIRHGLDAGQYKWKILCVDSNGSSAKSEERTLVIAKRTQETIIRFGKSNENGMTPISLFIIITLSILILFTFYELLSSKSFWDYMERRRLEKARGSLKQKLSDLDKGKPSWQIGPEEKNI